MAEHDANQPSGEQEAVPPPEPALEDAQAAADPQPAPPARAPSSSAVPVELPAFSLGEPKQGPKGIDLLADVNLNVKIELGRTRMLVEDVLKLCEGAVVELDKLAGDPVDVYVNDRPIARGEVLVLNDNFCVRINEILDPAKEQDVKARSRAG
jgi:flagellar motor switch protein FliN